MSRLDDFQNTIDIALVKLRSLDPTTMSLHCGATFTEQDGGGKIILPFFNREITIAYPEGTVRYEDGNGTLSLQEQGLVLHYILGAQDIPLSGDLITFREIPSGEFYYQPFLNRAQIPFVNTFGTEHAVFKTISAKFGAAECAIGDTAMVFSPFPKTPVTLVLWKGDDEFSPGGTILFDSSIKLFLNVEDIAFLASTVVYRLLALAKTYR